MSDSLFLVYDIISLVVYFIISGILSWYTLHFFTKNKSLSWGIFLVLWTTYAVCYFSIALVSIDLSIGLRICGGKKCSADDIPTYLVILWQIFYWGIQVLAWVIIPIAQSYVEAGQFTIPAKLWHSLLENVILYIVFGVVGVAFLLGLIIYIVYYAGTSGFTIYSTKGLVMSLSSAFGLFLLTSLLGYGIIQVPRYYWNKADLLRTLNYYEFKASKYFDDVDETLIRMKKLLSKVRALDIHVSEDDELRPLVDQLVANCRKLLEEHRITADSKPIVNVTKKKIVNLHKKVRQAKREYHRAAYEWNYLKERAFFLEDCIDSYNNPDKIIIGMYRKEPKTPTEWFFRRLEWIYRLHIKSYFYKFFSIFMGFFMIVIFYSECTPVFKAIASRFSSTFDGKYLSPFYWLIFGLSKIKIPFLTQLCSLMTIILISFVVYFALFNLKIPRFMQFVPHHTDDASLLFLSVILCRVIPTLLYNYVNMVGVTEKDGVAFSKVMGGMRLDELRHLGDFGVWFQYYFPLIIPLVAALTLFNVTGRILSMFRIPQFEFSTLATEAIEEGREILRRERKRINNEQYLDRQLHDDDNVVELYQNMESGYLRYNPINKTKQKKLTDRLKEFLNKHHKRTLSQEKEEMRELTDVKIRRNYKSDEDSFL